MRLSDHLRHFVASRSWDWLLELGRLFALEVELTDASGSPYLPVVTRPAVVASGVLSPDILRRLRPALQATVSSLHPQAAFDAARVLVLNPVRFGGNRVGVLVIAGPEDESRGVEFLSALAPFLTAAVERHLGSQTAGSELVGALIDTLATSSQGSTDRQLVEVFAEALAVWHEIDVVGYVETASGVFVRAMTLAGHAQVDPPLVFPPQAVPRPRTLTRMPLTAVDSGPRVDGGDVWLTTLTRTGDSRWLLTFGGGIDACEPALLSAYVAALDFTLTATARAERAELALSLDVILGDHPPRGLDGALAHLRRKLRASHVEFGIHRGDEAESATTAGHTDPEDAEIKIRRGAPGGPVRRLLVQRSKHDVWTPRDRALAETVADLFETKGVGGQPEVPTAAPEAVVSSAVSESLGRGSAATVGVFLASRALPATLAPHVLSEMARDLRPSDRVALLAGDREIAVVLSGTTADIAGDVLARARRSLQRTMTAAGIAIQKEGVATRMPGQGEADLLEDARRHSRT